jgi:uncharacterized membrane protein YhaH (DUF805 family)
MKMNESNNKIGYFVGILLVGILFTVITGFGLLIHHLIASSENPDPELMMGILVVFSIATLMTVLFIIAVGFKSMRIADPSQALGLPEGSIRAMIALVLIMVFIIFGIFLFRKVGTSSETYIGVAASTSDANIPKDKIVLFSQREDKKYDVWVVEPVTEEGKRLAQQLLTTVGTLVVAIASFYFGTTMVKKEREGTLAAQTETEGSNPVIKDITPKEGQRGQDCATSA